MRTDTWRAWEYIITTCRVIGRLLHAAPDNTKSVDSHARYRVTEAQHGFILPAKHSASDKRSHIIARANLVCGTNVVIDQTTNHPITLWPFI